MKKERKGKKEGRWKERREEEQKRGVGRWDGGRKRGWEGEREGGRKGRLREGDSH